MGGETDILWRIVFLTTSIAITLILAGKTRKQARIAIVLHIAILCLCKYVLNYLPLGISYLTFQQIALIMELQTNHNLPDAPDGDQSNHHALLDYFAYLLFFPKLLSGPITPPETVLSGLNTSHGVNDRQQMTMEGIRLINMGLCKKLLIADTLGGVVNAGMEMTDTLTAGETILVTLFFALQLYFDFSGYSDMAAGTGRFFGVRLPVNFNSPYKSCSVSEFWDRWHMSLTAFFTNYLYIPLGGNRKGTIRTYLNIFIVFSVSGLWHGEGATFLLWGALNGVAIIFERIASCAGIKIPKALGWCYTFLLANIGFLLFRATSIHQWLCLLKNCFSGSRYIRDDLIASLILPEIQMIYMSFNLHLTGLSVHRFSLLVMTVATLLICFVAKNSNERIKKLPHGSTVVSALLFLWALISIGKEGTFIYNGF